MKIIGHIIWKDLHALHRPLLVLAFTLAALFFERTTGIWRVGFRHSELGGFLAVVLAAFAPALVAALVLEDNMVSPNAFWRTRPVNRGILLVAKLPTMILIFVPAFTPLLILTDSAPFGPQAFESLAFMFCVAAVASMTKDLWQFLWGGALAVLIFGISWGFVSQIVRNRWIHDGAFDSAVMLAGLACACALVYHYLGGQRKYAIGLTVAGLVGAPFWILT